MSSDPNHQATADTSQFTLRSFVVAYRSPSTSSSWSWTARVATTYSSEHSLSISMCQCGTWFGFWAIAWSQFVRFFVNFDWVTASVAVSILQTTIKYVQNYFFSQLVCAFFLFSCCWLCSMCARVHLQVRAGSRFYWVPLYYSHSVAGLCANSPSSDSQFMQAVMQWTRTKRKLWPVSCTYAISRDNYNIAAPDYSLSHRP